MIVRMVVLFGLSIRVTLICDYFRRFFVKVLLRGFFVWFWAICHCIVSTVWTSLKVKALSIATLFTGQKRT